MPNVLVNATADDGYQSSSEFQTGSSWWSWDTIGFFILRNVAIPQGAVITQFLVDFHVVQFFNQPRIRLQAIMAGDAPDIVTGYLNGVYQKTEAYADKDFNALGLGSSGNWTSPNAMASSVAGLGAFDAKAVVQEVVNGPDWVSGNDIAFVVTPTSEGLYWLLQTGDRAASSVNVTKADFTLSVQPSIYTCEPIVAGEVITAVGFNLQSTSGAIVSHPSGAYQVQTMGAVTPVGGRYEVTFTAVEGSLPPLGPVTLTLTGGTQPAAIIAQMQPVAGRSAVILVDPYNDQSSIGYGAAPILASDEVIEWPGTDWIIPPNAVPYSVADPVTTVLDIRRWSPSIPGYDTGGTGTNGQYFNITVADSGAGNIAPTFTCLDTITVGRGETKNFTLTGFDVNADSLTFSLPSNPFAWVTFDDVDELTFTVDSNLPIGNYSFTVRVSDGTDFMDMPFTVHVTDVQAPVITLLGESSMTINVTTAYSEPGYAATDDVDGNITGNVVVSGFVNTDVPGTYMLVYSVEDAAGNVSASITRTVVVNGYAVFTSAAAITVNDWSTNTHALAVADEGAVTFSLVGTIPDGVTLSVDEITFEDQAQGSYAITARATDAFGLTTDQVITVTVDGRPVLLSEADYSFSDGQFIPITIETQDPEGNAITLSLVGTPPAGLLFNPVAGAQSSSNGLVYKAIISGVLGVGSYPLVLRASTASSGSTDFDIVITIVAAGNSAPVITSGDTITVTQGFLTVHTLTAADPNGDAVTFTLPVNLYSAWVTLNGSSITVAPPADMAPGAYQFTARASDESLSTSQVITVIVNSADSGNLAPQITSANLVTMVAGQTVSHQVMVVDDGVVSFDLEGTVPAGVTLNRTTGMVTANILVAGFYQAKVRATDSAGLYAEQTLSFTVQAVGALPLSTPKDRTIYLNRDGSVTYSPFYQDPDATIDYKVDIKRWLGSSDSVLSVEFMENNDMEIDAQEFNSNSGRVLVSGGLSGKSYEIVLKAYTVQNRIAVVRFFVHVVAWVI